MKRLLYLTLSLLSISILNAQNLIPNGNFEMGPDSSAEGWSLWWDSACSNPIPMNGPDFWIVTNGTPDRLLENDIFCEYDVDTAQSGKAWISYNPGEAGKAILINPIQKDSFYRLSYYASWETYQGLSTSPERAEFRFNNGGNIITTPYIALTQWQFYDTVFVALSNSTEIELTGNATVLAGVKLDNIILKKELKDTLNGLNPVKKHTDKIIIFPNPVRDKFTINNATTEKIKIEIYNSVGIMVKQVNCFHSGIIDISEFASGIYFVKVSFSNQIIIEKLIKN